MKTKNLILEISKNKTTDFRGNYDTIFTEVNILRAANIQTLQRKINSECSFSQTQEKILRFKATLGMEWTG